MHLTYQVSYSERSPALPELMRTRILAVVALLSLAVGVSIALLSPFLVGLYSMAVPAAVAAYVAYLLWNGRRDVFEPVYWLLVVWVLFFVLRPWAMLINDDLTLRSTYSVGAGLRPALGLAFVGLISFAISYEAASPVRLARHLIGDRVLRRQGPLLVGFLSLGIGILGILYQYGRPLAGDTAYLYYTPLLCVPGSLILFTLSSGLGRVAAIAGAAATVLMYVGIGQRAFVLLALIPLAVTYYTTRGSRPNIALVLAGGAVVFFGVLGYLDVARSTPDGSLGGGPAAEDLRPEALVGRVITGPSTEMLPALALEVQTEGSLWSIDPGYLVTSILAHPVPGSLWPGKPPSYAEMLYSRLFPSHYALTKANVQFSILGDFYFGGGLLGVVLGCVALGLVFKATYVWMIEARRSPLVQALFGSLLALSVVLLRGDIALTMGLALYVCGPIVVALLTGGRGVSAR